MEIFDPDNYGSVDFTPKTGGASDYTYQRQLQYERKTVSPEIDFLKKLGNFSEDVPIWFDYERDLDLYIDFALLEVEDAEGVEEQFLIRRLKKYDQLTNDEFDKYVTAVTALYQDAQRVYKEYAVANAKSDTKNSKVKKTKNSVNSKTGISQDDYGRQINVTRSYRYGYFMGQEGLQPTVFYLKTSIAAEAPTPKKSKYEIYLDEEFDKFIFNEDKQEQIPDKTTETVEVLEPVYKIDSLSTKIAKDVESERLYLSEAIDIIDRNLKLLCEPFAKHITNHRHRTVSYVNEINRVHIEGLVRWPIVRSDYKELIEETRLNIMLLNFYFVDWSCSEPITKQEAEKLNEPKLEDYSDNDIKRHSAIKIERPDSSLRANIASEYPYLLRYWDDTEIIN